MECVSFQATLVQSPGGDAKSIHFRAQLTWIWILNIILNMPELYLSHRGDGASFTGCHEGHVKKAVLKAEFRAWPSRPFCPRLLHSTIRISLGPQRLPRTEHSWQRHSEESLCN